MFFFTTVNVTIFHLTLTCMYSFLFYFMFCTRRNALSFSFLPCTQHFLQRLPITVSIIHFTSFSIIIIILSINTRPSQTHQYKTHMIIQSLLSGCSVKKQESLSYFWSNNWTHSRWQILSGRNTRTVVVIKGCCYWWWQSQAASPPGDLCTWDVWWDLYYYNFH